MAIFGRRSARQRLRSAARESLAIPAFSTPVDCSAWVLDGLWPAELATITPDTAPLADYLNADLQRIANSANDKLHAIGRSGLAGQARQTAEARVINVARAFAVLRVESTVRQLHKEALDVRAKYASLNAAPTPVEVSVPIPVHPELSSPAEPPAKPENAHIRAARHRMPEPAHVEPPADLPASTPQAVRLGSPAPTPPPVVVGPPPSPPVAPPPPPPDVPPPPAPRVPAPEVAEVPEVIEPGRPAVPFSPGPVIIDTVDEEPPTTAIPAEPVVTSPAEELDTPPEAPQHPTGVVPEVPEPVARPAPEPVLEPVPEPAPPPAPTPAAVAESEDQRLQRLLAFVARQEPGLRWAVGTSPAGETLLVTDLVGGWIPSGIEIPAGVQLLEPGRRTGTAAAMLGTSSIDSATYSPGDRLGWASDYGSTETSVQPRELAVIEDLGWQLSEATHWRDGLPRMANTLAKAGASGTGVIDAEIDLLRVYLDTVRYQLLAQYPDGDTGLVLNCMLLAATEGIATGDTVSANYHYSWFRTLSAPPVSQWDPQA